ncbi:transferase, partial [Alistipes shahii]
YRLYAASAILNQEDSDAKPGASATQLPETSFPGFEGAGTFSQAEIDWEEFDSVVYNLEKIEEFLHN